MKAYFEIEFEPDMMCDQETVDDKYGGSWFQLIKFLYENEGLGIFENDLKLTGVES